MIGSFLIKIVFCGALVAAAIGTRFILKNKSLGKPDNQIEECVEYTLKEMVNIDIDLSPDTPDKDVDFDQVIKEVKESLL